MNQKFLTLQMEEDDSFDSHSSGDETSVGGPMELGEQVQDPQPSTSQLRPTATQGQRKGGSIV